MRIGLLYCVFCIGWNLSWMALGQVNPVDTSRGDHMIGEYFRQETAAIRDHCLEQVETLEDWQSLRGEYKRQLLEMLGLDPLPQRTDLAATITGKAVHNEFVVENLHFQSRPGLYVTGNLYLPRNVTQRLPAVLYVCGHGRVKKNNISYGNKANYQHHGAWFARNGYVCLTIDTLQLGEIEGIHHGTYRYDMWWWLNRGYTPAGVEAWNCVRALDYLQTRDEVDPDRIGVTGRSGGGAYSWWIAAIDDRIKAAVPVAGITDLENHVIDGTVEGHCDCMFMFNTYRWDYPQVAALVAPRPLLISNSDRDRIFPLEGIVRTHAKVRKIYQLYGAADQLALQITAGPHQDTQELRIHAFRWLNQHLRGDDRLIDTTAQKFFEPEDLKVFDEHPSDELNTTIERTFVPTASVGDPPQNASQWQAQRDQWRKALGQRTFRGWPSESGDLAISEVFSATQDGIQLRALDFTSQGPFRLRLYVAHRQGLKQPDLVVLNVLDQASWMDFLATMRPAFEEQLGDEALPTADPEALEQTAKMLNSFDWVMAYIAPRGIGPSLWDQTPKKQVQHRRRFYLLGQSLDGMRVWDVQQAARALRSLKIVEKTPLWLQSHRRMAGVALYGALYVPQVSRLDLYELPPTHEHGPFLLNVRSIWDTPQALAMAAEESKVVLYGQDQRDWTYALSVVQAMGWGEKRIQLRSPPPATDHGGERSR